MFKIIRVKKLRENLNLSETQFAKRIGVSQATYNRLEKGNGNFTADAVGQIVKIFEVSPYWLLLGEGGEEPVFIKQPNPTDQITITKDEFIELQRKALRQEDRIRELEKQVEELRKG
ncbi:helix-turn-helix domain-containing protein [Dyadobacter chenwenxiniae]|uniref:Helix-turn-helix domain-containing protein n=1 Tax=Dyadobacter chenwenxiniae TaxID=2906456 RepID=A0A9X1PP73_9BACT|nr:helix-turn-helix transcriptional regulator [Dyadobacter chenwenxiniae]MCF0064922.1 helix-turn-helix domain-containing protein [Dyadobacter chenwenxiniae]UON83044.1 helix-turn-helix domain-containing protein [Dyadobacter chenwenxiniae]